MRVPWSARVENGYIAFVQTAARLIPSHVPDAPVGAVIVLHGGASRRAAMRVSPTQLSVLRMVPIARRIARTGGEHVAVFRLLNSVRGWDTSHTPVDDARWALQQLQQTYGLTVPVCLVGHSLGGRAAILATGAATVSGVIALNPFVYPQDGDVRTDGHSVVIVQGTADRIARPDRSLAVAERLRRRTPTALISVDGGKHAMLHRHDVYSRLAAQVAVAMLTKEVADSARPVMQALRDGTNITV